MSLPRKKSRLITVDGVRYRWLVRETNAYPEAILYVELDTGPSNLLQLRYYAYPQHPAITPGSVESSIRDALHKGWDPGCSTYRIFDGETGMIAE